MLDPKILQPFLLDDDPWVGGAVARFFDEPEYGGGDKLASPVASNSQDTSVLHRCRPQRER